MIDLLESLYQRGYEIGLTGVKTACPEDIYQKPDHSERDAWVEGYLAGRKEYWRNSRRKEVMQGGLGHLDETHGKLWVDPKENGCISIRDCEGGTLLASVHIDGEIYITVPEREVSPIMAYFLGRAIQKAAGIGYRIQQSRLLKF